MLFEDNKPRRELLKILIDSSETMTCTAVYEDCKDIVKHISANTPDVALMDIDMPNVDGIQGLRLIRKNFPMVKVLMQTVFEEDDKIFDAILAGADGYILKKTPPLKLLEAITDVYEGGSPMTPTVARQVLSLLNKPKSHAVLVDFQLTNREKEILTLLVKGLSYKMIADKCSLTYATVNSHISHIYQKLHVSSGTEAVAKAIENRIV